MHKAERRANERGVPRQLVLRLVAGFEDAIKKRREYPPLA